jgi:4-amino-4-deoxy-L-arabinose transferase-like glycosyltransferase
MLLACWLRARGIDYPTSYHPDEIVYVSHSVRMALSGDFRPGWYEHATLHLTALAALFRLLGGPSLPAGLDPASIQRIVHDPPAGLFLIARWFSVMWSVAQLPLVYLVGARLGGRWLATCAAGLLAIAPLDVWEAHFALNNQMVSFWMLLGLLGCVRVAQTGNGYALAAVAAGLAQATRYTGIFVLLGLGVAHACWMIRAAQNLDSRQVRWPRLSVITLAAVLSAIGIWEIALGDVTGLTFQNLVRSTGPLEQIASRLGLKPAYDATGPGLSLLPFGRLCLAAGLVLAMLAVAAQLRPALRPLLLHGRRRLLVAMLMSAVVFLLAMPWVLLDADLVATHIRLQLALNAEPRFGFDRSPAGWQYQHWVYELLVGLPFGLGPGLYLLACVGLVTALLRPSGATLVIVTLLASYLLFIGSGSRVFLRYLVPMMPVMCLLGALGGFSLLHVQPQPIRATGAVLVAAALAFTGYFTWTTNERFNPDTRLLAAEWIAAHVPPGESIGMNTIPELSPPVDRSVYRVIEYDRAVRSDWVEPIIYLPRYLIISSAIYNRALRDPVQYDFYLDGYQRIWAGQTPFQLLIRWDSPFPLRDIFSRLDPMLAAYYVSPTIEIYRR